MRDRHPTSCRKECVGPREIWKRSVWHDILRVAAMEMDYGTRTE